MVINLWYNSDMKLWRWSLTETNLLEQHSGGQPELRSALNDVEELKTFKTKAVTIFTGVQVGMGALWAAMTYFTGG